MTNEEVINELNLMEMVVRTSKATEAVKIATSALRAQQQPNAPLTLDELREMDGEPVWVEFIDSVVRRDAGWFILSHAHKGFEHLYGVGGTAIKNIDSYGKTWLAYRHKPEEETQ